MPATAIQELTARLRASDPANAQEQREIFERIRELRSTPDGPPDPDYNRRLEAAGMLVDYLARMGTFAGEEVRTIALRLLGSASEAGRAPADAVPLAAVPAPVRPTLLKLTSSKQGAPAPPAPAAARSATEMVGEMMLGQILLQRGQILEEHIQQALRVQRGSSLRIGDILLKIGACTRAQVADALNHQAAMRRVRGNLGEETPAADTRGTGLKIVGEALLGEILVERNVVTRRQLERALEVQKQTGSRIGEALVQIGATTLEQIEQALRIQSRERRTLPGRGAGGGGKR